jgi:serine/tyrosine/threonine adenylyltransferase
MWQKLGLDGEIDSEGLDLLNATLELLSKSQVGYHDFFVRLTDRWQSHWQQDPNGILTDSTWLPGAENYLATWPQLYQRAALKRADLALITPQLQQHNPRTVPLRPLIEATWDAIADADNWQPFADLVAQLRA